MGKFSAFVCSSLAVLACATAFGAANVLMPKKSGPGCKARWCIDFNDRNGGKFVTDRGQFGRQCDTT